MMKISDYIIVDLIRYLDEILPLIQIPQGSNTKSVNALRLLKTTDLPRIKRILNKNQYDKENIHRS